MKQLNCFVFSSLIIVLFTSCAGLHSFQADTRMARDKEKGNFVVTTDGATIKGEEVRQRFPLLKRSYVEIDNGDRVNLRDIEILQDDKAYHRRVDGYGLIPRIKKGGINTYLTFSTTQTYNPSGMGTGTMNAGARGWSTSTRPVYFIQKSDSGVIMQMNPDRLNAMVADYQPALDFMNEYYDTRRKTRIWSYINTAALIGGVALAASSIGSEGDIKPIGYVGVGLSVGGLLNGFVNKFRKSGNQKNLEFAIDEYNRKKR